MSIPSPESTPALSDDEIMAAHVAMMRDGPEKRAEALEAATRDATDLVGAKIAAAVKRVTLRARRHIREQGLDDQDAEVYMAAIQKGLRHGVMRAISFQERDLGPQPWERVDWP